MALQSDLMFMAARLVDNLAEKVGATQARGGGLYAAYSIVSMDGTLLASNQADAGGGTSHGGAVYSDNSRITIRNSVLDGNIADTEGHGLSLDLSAMIENATLVNHAEAVRRRGGDINIYNSILWDNTVDLAGFPTDGQGVLTNIWFSNLGSGLNNENNGCISADPLFVAPLEGDYRLQSRHGRWSVADHDWIHDSATSPCIDGGTNRAWMVSATDYDGLSRLARGSWQNTGATVDMGAFEAHIRPRGSVFKFR